jgi:prepilin-type N-terminal cleavage/methylation domain-containing protein
MRLPPSSTNATLRQRRSFTLVELLIVIGIISVLAGLSIGAVMATIGFQHQKNTKFYMRELKGATKKRWDAVVQSAGNEDMSNTIGSSAYSTIASNWAGDNGGPLTRVMYVKFRLKQEFPTSFAEALSPWPLPPNPNYVAYLNNLGITTANTSATAPANYESSACLYMALTQGTSGTNFKADQFANAVRDFTGPGNKPVKTFADDWGNPLVFCRWATGDTVLDGLSPLTSTNTAVRDLQDPDGQLLNANWNNPTSTGCQNFQQYGHSVTSATNPGQPYAYYTIPVLMSYGPDGLPGLAAVTGPYYLQTLARDGTNASADNIYSYNLDRE